MGNMPNRWVGRGVALGIAVLAGVAAYFLGGLAGERLAYGFTFDWYVHAVDSRYETGEVLTWVSLGTTLAALLTLILFTGPVSLATHYAAKRMGYAPPRYKRATTLDVHAGKLGFVLGQTGLLAALLLYVYFSFPVEWRDGAFLVAPAYGDISPDGFVLLMSVAAAAGAFVGTFLTVATTYSGIVDGRISKDAGVNLLAHISIFASRNAKTTVALVLAVTMVAGYYASTVTTNVDVADVLPRGDPNTAAAKNLTTTFKSSFTQAVTWQFRAVDTSNASDMRLYEENENVLVHRATEVNATNISDEVYVRAMAEVIEFVTAQEPFVGSVGAPDLFKLINWTLAGGNDPDLNPDGDATFSLPTHRDEQNAARYRSVHDGVFAVGPVYSGVDAVTSPSWRQTAILVTVDPKSEADSRYIGERAFEIRDLWLDKVRRGQTEFTVFGPDNPPMFTYDLPLANAHASELTQKDFSILLPIIGVFIAVTLFIAFRSVTSVVVTFSALSIAVIWTFGAMGALEIPLNTINLAVVPLIMGVGIDYSIHMMNEYQEFRAKGKSAEEAWTETGRGSAFALFVGALTTIAGLVVMIISPSLLVAQLGILGSVALVSTYILAVMFIPAAISMLGGDRKRVKQVRYTPSRIMPAIATAVSRSRVLVVVVIALLTFAAFASAANLRREAFGDPPRNWLEDDEHRLEHEEALRGFYDSDSANEKTNILIIEGDLTDPQVHRYINSLTATLRSNAQNGTVTLENGTVMPSRVIGDTLKDLPFLLNTYLTVRGGIPGAAGYLGGTNLGSFLEDRGLEEPGASRDLTEPYPDTRTELRAILDEVWASPLYQLGNLFADHPTYSMTVITFGVRAATYEDAEGAWHEVQAAIAANEALRPEGTKTSYFGNTAINYLFVAKQVPWLSAMSIVTITIITVIVFAFTRKIVPTIAVAGVSYLTSTLWYGILPTEHVDIGLAINLTLPLIFITAMGSDYALHLAMRCQRSGDTRETFESVGKGVMFSFVTTLGAFLIFTQISDYSGRRSIIGTVLAIATVFLVTTLVIPLLYPVKKDPHGAHGRSVPVVETRRNRAPQTIVAAAPAKREAAPAPVLPADGAPPAAVSRE